MKILTFLSCLALLAAVPSVALSQSQSSKNTKPETAAMLERLKKLPTATTKDNEVLAEQSKPQKSDTASKTDRKIAKLLKSNPSRVNLDEQQLPLDAFPVAALQIKESSAASNGVGSASGISSFSMGAGGSMHGDSSSTVYNSSVALNISNSAEGSLNVTTENSVVFNLTATMEGDRVLTFRIGDFETSSLSELQALFGDQKFIYDGGGNIYIQGLQFVPISE